MNFTLPSLPLSSTYNPFVVISVTPVELAPLVAEAKKLCFGYNSGHSPALNQEEQNHN